MPTLQILVKLTVFLKYQITQHYMLNDSK